ASPGEERRDFERGAAERGGAPTPGERPTGRPGAPAPARANGATVIAIQADAIMKHYGSRAALFGASLAVRAGTIHAVVGEKGAGRGPRAGVVYGEPRAEGGQLSLKGRAVPLGTHAPRDAIAAGVGMVHQHFMLVPTLSVLDNVVLGREPRRGPFVDVRRAAAEVAEVGKRLGLEGVDRPVEELSVGGQQRAGVVQVLGRRRGVTRLGQPT